MIVIDVRLPSDSNGICRWRDAVLVLRLFCSGCMEVRIGCLQLARIDQP